ncbi:RNA polymerase sigma factor [Evansella sp. AB-rgal1]|uniref:RNA polymerase sigma factor n=1 Tax=Evansella sp. AB-rgal1 TaxID=3242696 RepID=UPI00359ED857
MDNEQKLNQLEDWYRTYSDDIHRFIVYMIRDREQAKDLMQDTFVKAYSNYDSFWGENTKSWLFSIARNLTIDYMRKKRPISYITEYFHSIPDNNELSPEQSVTLNEQENEFLYSLAKLKRPYREVIILRRIQEMSIKETATILGWSEGKVKTNLKRGLDSLEKQMKEGGVFK